MWRSFWRPLSSATVSLKSGKNYLADFSTWNFAIHAAVSRRLRFCTRPVSSFLIMPQWSWRRKWPPFFFIWRPEFEASILNLNLIGLHQTAKYMPDMHQACGKTLLSLIKEASCPAAQTVKWTRLKVFTNGRLPSPCNTYLYSFTWLGIFPQN